MVRSMTLAAVGMLLCWSPLLGGDQVAATARSIPASLKAFPQQGPTTGLEPEVLDFRYHPSRWQTCIGLVDDPMKTIVGDDGGLYYDYGQQGPEPYNNGQGTFGTRVFARFAGTDQPGPLQQSLYSPRVPLVISKQRCGEWDFVQEAWSAVVPGAHWNRTGTGRVDYLSLATREFRICSGNWHGVLGSWLNAQLTARQLSHSRPCRWS